MRPGGSSWRRGESGRGVGAKTRRLPDPLFLQSCPEGTRRNPPAAAPTCSPMDRIWTRAAGLPVWVPMNPRRRGGGALLIMPETLRSSNLPATPSNTGEGGGWGRGGEQGAGLCGCCRHCHCHFWSPCPPKEPKAGSTLAALPNISSGGGGKGGQQLPCGGSLTTGNAWVPQGIGMPEWEGLLESSLTFAKARMEASLKQAGRLACEGLVMLGGKVEGVGDLNFGEDITRRCYHHP